MKLRLPFVITTFDKGSTMAKECLAYEKGL